MKIIFYHTCIYILDKYEKNLLEEYCFFVKGFQQIIKIENIVYVLIKMLIKCVSKEQI